MNKQNLLSVIFIIFADLTGIQPHSLPDYFGPVKKEVQVALIKLENSLHNDTHIIESLENAETNPEIQAIWLEINCNGGYPAPAEQIHRTISKIKQTKPVIAFVKGSCLSAAYGAVCSANTIISLTVGLIGSIGVITSLPVDNHKNNEKHLKCGKFKDLFVRNKKNKEESEYVQGLLDSSYKIFTEAVAQSRPQLKLKELDKWADGKIFTAEQAKKVGLIDHIGGRDEVKKTILSLLKLIKSPEDQGCAFQIVPMKLNRNQNNCLTWTKA